MSQYEAKGCAKPVMGCIAFIIVFVPFVMFCIFILMSILLAGQ